MAMLINKTIRYFTQSAPKLVNMKVNYEGLITSYAFPVHTKLAKNLLSAKVPL